MSSSQLPTDPPLSVGIDQLPPEGVTSEGLPVVIRGYDRERVDRLLARVSESYRELRRQRDGLRERLTAIEAEVEAAEAEARVSAKSVGELMQRVATAENELVEARSVHDDLAERLRGVEGERRKAVAEQRETAERAAELEKRVQTLEQSLRQRPLVASEPAQASAVVSAPVVASVSPGPALPSEAEAARLLLAAMRASDELREAAREQARSAIKKARRRAATISEETERERLILADVLVQRREAEREAQEVLARAEVEAKRVAAAIGDERERVRALLAGALESLEPSAGAPGEGLLADLSSRLREQSDADRQDPGADAQRDEQQAQQAPGPTA